MKAKPIIHCTVTNDLNQDQRMHRICTSLVHLGFDVTLVGRTKTSSPTLLALPFKQKRIYCYFQKGLLFYAEYNLKLWWWLVRQRIDIIYSVDTDTLLPAVLTKTIKRNKIIFDAHEYFTEVPELQGKNIVKSFWSLIEKMGIPHANLALTVNESIAEIYTKKFNVKFNPIYNVPIKNDGQPTNISPFKYLLYQGVLNKGRGLEAMISAMDHISDLSLFIAGDGDISTELKILANNTKSSERIIFTGYQTPQQLKALTQNATLGINLLEGTSQNYYYSLANKFFDYMHANVPSINMAFPEYIKILAQFDVGYTIDDLDPLKIATLINEAIKNEGEIKAKINACDAAKLRYNWASEEEKLAALMKEFLET